MLTKIPKHYEDRIVFLQELGLNHLEKIIEYIKENLVLYKGTHYEIALLKWAIDFESKNYDYNGNKQKKIDLLKLRLKEEMEISRLIDPKAST